MQLCNFTTSAHVTQCTVVNSDGVFGSVNDVVCTSDANRCWIGSVQGLFEWERKSGIHQITVVNDSVTAVGVHESTGALVAGTELKLWRRLSGDRWHFFRVPGIIDAPINALAFDQDGTLWIANEVCINQQHSDLTFHRIGGLEGLPTANLTSISFRQDNSFLYALLTFPPVMG